MALELVTVARRNVGTTVGVKVRTRVSALVGGLVVAAAALNFESRSNGGNGLAVLPKI
jgi:hypothetical protein